MKDLLLLHGAVGSKDQFAPLIEKLNGDFNVHALNFSGHGGSGIAGSFSIRTFADDVLRYMLQRGIESADIFGYSMGGYVGLYLARHYPEKIGKVFTFATKFEWSPEIAAREVKMLDAGKIEEKIPAFAKQLESRHHPADWKQVLSKTAEMMIAMGEDNPLKPEDYAQIDCPVLIGIGDRDVMVTLEETIAVYKQLPQSGLVVLPQTQHPLEKVDAGKLAREIRNFFS